MTKLKETDLLELPKGTKVKDLTAAVGIISNQITTYALNAVQAPMSKETYERIRHTAVVRFGAKKKTLTEVEI